MIIFNSPECTEYSQKEHPESPLRIINSIELLEESGFSFQPARVAAPEEILLAHSSKHIQNLWDGDFYDPDSPDYSGIYNYARLSAGAAIEAAKYCASEKENTFSLMRPPGHHAGRETVMGFCYLNNVAIAALNSLQIKGIEKIALLDIDNHRGNGTQDIVRGNPQIIHVDLHSKGDYPNGKYPSERNCINFALPQKSFEQDYLKTLDEGLGIIKRFGPDLILVSAGFDTFEGDPVGTQRLNISSYQKIAEQINSLRKPVCSVLEGGYNTEALPYCISNYLSGF